MRTTIDLPDPLFKEVKTRAVSQGVTLKELVTGYIESGLRRSDAVPGKRRPLPVAFKRVPGAPPVPARSNAELFSILDAEDVESHRGVSSHGPSDP